MSLILEILGLPVLVCLIMLVVPNYKLCGRIASLAAWTQLVIVILTTLPCLAKGQNLIPGPGFLLDRMSACFLILTALASACSLSHAHLFFTAELASKKPPETFHIRLYFAFALLFLASMLAVFLCNNLGFLWISLEATTLLSASLVYFNREKHAIEATWKYLIICSVGIAFALLGTIFLFAASQHGAIPSGSLNITDLVSVAPRLEPTLARVGFIFCFLGYGTKAGMFPLHSWLPDAHSEAPAPASAMLSGCLLNCALFAIWRLSEISSGANANSFMSNLCIWGGTVTVLAASFFLVRQHGLKRLWAYSSIENVGLMMVAIGIGSGAAFLLQAVNHSLSKIALFLLSGNIIQASGSKELSEIKGVLTFAPTWGILLCLSALAITGVPPFGSFISELIILACSAKLSQWLPFALIIWGLSLAFVAVCAHAGRILLGSPRVDTTRTVSWKYSLIPGLLVVCSLALGIGVGPHFVAGWL